MKKIILICLIMCSATSLFAGKGKRHIEESAGYSICVPNMWQYTDTFNMEYRAIIFFKEEFSPRLLFLIDKYTGPLDPYMNATIENFKKDITFFEFIEKKEFVTESGIKGIKFVFVGTQGGRRIRNIFYIFKNPNNQTFVVLCHCLAKNKRYEKTFDKCIATLQFE